MHDDGNREPVRDNGSHGPSEYTREEVVEKLRVDPDFAARLWAAFGFADDPDPRGAEGPGEPAFVFSDRDLAALAVFVGRDREMNPAAQLAAARSIGQATARLAEWEAEQIRAFSADPAVDLTTEQLIDAVGHIHHLVWRRHLHGFLDRASAAGDDGDDGDGDDGSSEVIVGFADIVGYTSLSRRLHLAELEALLEAFESAAHRIITGHDGQVIKSIGDAVMFTAPTSATAAAIAFELHGLTSDGQLPTLRIGMASGPALTRMGDVFGEPVNIAARLAGAAHAGTTLVDQNLAGALEPDPAFYLNHISTLSVRGYRRLRAHVLRPHRAHGTDAEPPSAEADSDASGKKQQRLEEKLRKREKKAQRKGAKEFAKRLEADAAD